MAAAIAFPTPESTEVALVSWKDLQTLPCRLTAELSVAGFTVGDLLRLEVGSLVDSKAASRENVTLRVNGSRIGHAKFEVSGERLSVRFVELE